MRIGITTSMEHSMFSSGISNTSLAIAELMKGLGHEPTLLNVRGTKAWWDDCTALKPIFKVAHLEADFAALSASPFDILFEISPLSITAVQRQSIAVRSVWVLRKPFVLQEIELSIYPVTSAQRDLTGISEAWLLHDVTDVDDVTLLETIARVPVRHVPYVWTPLISEMHLRSTGNLAWKGDPSNPLFIPIVDTNNTNASNSTIPLVILRELKRQKFPISGWRMHNGDMIEKSKFFRENVLKHCSDLDLSGSCVGRQRSIDWIREENNVPLMHMRFRALRPVLLDLAWAGIPVVHNSPAFKEIGAGADRLYYSNNSIGEGVTAFQNLIADMKEGTGWFQKDNKRREEILRRWSPISTYVKNGWSVAMNGLSGAPLPPPLPTAALQPQPPPAKPKPDTNREVFRVAFSDMWESFSPTYNFFLLLLNEAGKHMTPLRRAEGFSAKGLEETPDIVVFGPFGSEWKRFGSAVPKVHFTGENTRPIFEGSVELNLGFDHIKLVPYEKYIRFPLWMTYIDWFGADVDKLVNPKPMPLSWCTTSAADTLESRSRFCSFVVSNPRNPLRNAAFQSLSEYKPVDSAGRLYTNVDPVTSPFAGGGGGELDKVAFYRNYKFCLTYENSEHAGYTTEKFLHAKAAGCVPIYWGDPKVEHDFDMDGAIDARRFKTPEELRAAVEAVDTDDALWRSKAAIPALKEYDVEVARRTLSEVAKRMWGIMGADTKDVPRFIGTNVASASASPKVVPAKKAFTPEVPIVTTYVTWKFLGSLQHWLNAIHAQTQALPTLKAHIWNGGDIPEETLEKLQEKFPFATFETVPTSTTPPDFDDFWDPTHYAWKLWVYHTMATRPDFKDKMILYMDAGAVLCKWPMEWMRVAQEAGLALLEDPRQENERWSSEAFCDALNVTDEERKAKQIWAGSAYFRGGSELATQFFAEAFRLGQIRKVLVGPRLSGVATDGHAYGHRQDQSVLSILVRRFPVPLLPLDTVYGDHSMRKTAAKGQAIYAHRGNFNTHVQPIKGIDDVFVINLDRRADRMEKFLATHPELDGIVDRLSATDGRQLRLTSEIAKIFTPNDFFWKKAVLGCALSHMGLWWKLVNDHAEIGNYLIFEDDAKMVPGWRATLEASMDHVPDDYDVLYLGGILPPNRAGFETVLEPVTKYYSRIRPNSFFGQKPPSPYFHSCAYAYVLSRRGADKIFKMMMGRGGFWTSADHIMCGPNSDLITYFLTPLVAGCYQDDDPAYASSEFNNFSRVDKFDSDLWNNDERFTKEEVISKLALSREDATFGGNLDIIYGLAAAPVSVPCNAPVLAGTKAVPVRFVTLEGHGFDFGKLCERDWLLDMMGGITSAPVECVDVDSPPPSDCPIFILQRPHVVEGIKLLHAWSEAGAKFKILHLSDEGIKKEHRDPLVAYTFTGCVKVLRFYNRDDFPAEVLSKILVIPLGPREGRSDGSPSPKLPFREIHWSFFGTDWMNRSKDMKPLTDAKFTNKYKFMKEWNDPTGLSATDYKEIMLNTMFVPCPGGMNWETFRLYEALECGCIPLVIKTEENDAWFRWISNKIPLLPITSWDDAVRLMMTLMSNQRRIEVYRDELSKGWSKWKKEVKGEVGAWMLA